MPGITDNSVVYQGSVDGKPIECGRPAAGVAIPALAVFANRGRRQPAFDHDQQTGPIEVVAYNFYDKLELGVHIVEIFAVAGSGVCVDSSNLICVNPRPDYGAPVRPSLSILAGLLSMNR